MPIPPSSFLTPLKETLGTKLRRLANQAFFNDPWLNPPMQMPLPWQPNMVFLASCVCINGGNLYVASAGGTAAPSGGPTATDSSTHADGTGTWIYYKGNPITTDPNTTQTNWAQGMSGTLAQQVIANSKVYACVATATYTFTVSGVSVSPTNGAAYTNNGQTFYVVSTNIAAGSGTILCTGTGAPGASGTLTKSSGTGDSTISFSSVATATTSMGSGTGPSGTSNQVVDNGLVWTYLGPYQTNPYEGSDFPTLTFSGTTALTNYYQPAAGQIFNALRAVPVAQGSGYAVGDTITLAGGTFTTAAILTVTAVAGGLITAVSVTTAGKYTALYTSAAYTQSSTSGSGTGATFAVAFNNPGWCDIAGGYVSWNISNSQGQWYTFQAIPPSGTPRTSRIVQSFWTDAPSFAININSNQPCAITIDGKLWSYDSVRNNSTTTWWTFTFPGGRKPRLIEIYTASGSARIAGVYVDNNSTVWAPDKQDKVTAILISDSVIDGAGYGPFVNGNFVAHRLRGMLGWKNIWDFSLGGTGYTNAGSYAIFGSRVPEAANQNPDIWLLEGSTNDTGASGATIQAAVIAMLTSIRAVSAAPIVVFGCWSYQTSALTVEQAVQTAVTTFADANTFFVPIYQDADRPWITGSWNNAPFPNGLTLATANNSAQLLGSNGSQVHPVDIGTEYFARRLANALKSQVFPLIN